MAIKSPMASPPMTMPVMAMPSPMTAVPAPMTAVPAPVTPVPVPMPMMAPAHLFGPEMIDIILRDDSGFGGVARRRHEMRLY